MNLILIVVIECILKLSNELFFIGDKNGTINQYKIVNKKIIKESSKTKTHENSIRSMTLLNDMIISGGKDSNDIKIWKKQRLILKIILKIIFIDKNFIKTNKIYLLNF